MTVLDQAENVGGIVSAARQRERWQQQMAKTSDPERREALRDAIGTLEVRFPELEELGPGEAERFARERGHGKGARSPSHEGRARRRAPVERKAPPAKPSPTKSSPKPRSTSSSGSSSSKRSSSRSSSRLEQRVRGRGGHAYRETGIPATGASISRIAMSALGATVGLALVYLLLTSAERGGSGGKALPGMLEAITGFLRRIVAPRDFFGPPLTQHQYSSAIAGAGQRSNEALLAQLPPLHPPKDPTPVKPLHIRPAELGFSPKSPRHSRR